MIMQVPSIRSKEIFMTDISESLSLRGDVFIIKTDAFGNTEEWHHKNTVVSVGKTRIAARLTSNSTNVMTHMAIGVGTTAAAAGDTTLGSESARVALSVSGGTPSSNTITYTGVFPAGTPGTTVAVTEAGVFDASSGGTLLCRTTFPAINKTTADQITVTWVVSII
jgi:hypothetical protein